jgi:hypothetical protein
MLGKLLKLLSRRQGAAGGQFRESSSRTTIHLLEMNRKFELFMRAKVRKLEERVSRLQARPGQGQAEDRVDEDGYTFSQSGDGGTREDIRADDEMKGPAQTAAAPPGVNLLGGWQAVNEVTPASSPAIEIGLPDDDAENRGAVELEETEISSSPVPVPTSVIPAGGGVSLLTGSTGAGGPVETETVETSPEPAPTAGVVGLDGDAGAGEAAEAEEVVPAEQGQGQIPAPASTSMLGGHYQLAVGQSDRGRGADNISVQPPATDDNLLPVEETELLDAEEDDEVGVEMWEDRELKGEGIKPRFT